MTRYKKYKIITPDVSWKETTPGGIIEQPGNSAMFLTGDWRSMRPIWIEEKCKQCMLCVPVCPDMALMVNEEGKFTGIDYDYCKGCGVCTKVCPFHAYDFVEEGKK